MGNRTNFQKTNGKSWELPKHEGLKVKKFRFLSNPTHTHTHAVTEWDGPSSWNRQVQPVHSVTFFHPKTTAFAEALSLALRVVERARVQNNSNKKLKNIKNKKAKPENMIVCVAVVGHQVCSHPL